MITLIIHREFYTTILSRIKFKIEIISKKEYQDAIYISIQPKVDDIPFTLTEDELVTNLKAMICKDKTFQVAAPSVGVLFIKCIIVAFDTIFYII